MNQYMIEWNIKVDVTAQGSFWKRLWFALSGHYVGPARVVTTVNEAIDIGIAAMVQYAETRLPRRDKSGRFTTKKGKRV